MKKTTALLALIGFCYYLLNASETKIVSRIIVKLHSDAYADNKTDLSNNILPQNISGITDITPFILNPSIKHKRAGLDRIHFIDCAISANIDSILLALSDLNIFEYVIKDEEGHIANIQEELIPNDPYFSQQWGLYNDGSFNNNSIPGADIKAVNAWSTNTGNKNIIAAILDTGLEIDHPDLEGRVWINPNEIPGDNLDNDNNGYVDDINGWNFNGNNALLTDDNDGGHGTAITGIIGANGNNGIGLAGVDWQCTLMPVKVANAVGGVLYSSLALGVMYAVDHGANVINLSIAYPAASPIIEDACNYAYDNNVAVVCASGNTGIEEKQYPAAYENTIAVGAVRTDGNRAEFSTYGDYLTLVAPGSKIAVISNVNDNDYSRQEWGTSFAAPYVVGAISLMLAVNPYLTVNQITDILTQTATDQITQTSEDVEGYDKYFGYGWVNLDEALKIVNGTTGIQTKFSDEDNFDLEIYPNPCQVGNDLNIILNKEVGEVKIKIYDVTGKEIKNIYLIDGASAFDFKVKWNDVIPDGIYSLLIRDQDQIITKNFLIVQ